MSYRPSLRSTSHHSFYSVLLGKHNWSLCGLTCQSKMPDLFLYSITCLIGLYSQEIKKESICDLIQYTHSKFQFAITFSIVLSTVTWNSLSAEVRTALFVPRFVTRLNPIKTYWVGDTHLKTLNRRQIYDVDFSLYLTILHFFMKLGARKVLD